MTDPDNHIKLLFDFFKHLTTLDTAAILLLVALAEKGVTHGAPTMVVAGTFSCFGLSLAGCLVVMLTMAIPRQNITDGWRTAAWVLVTIISLGSTMLFLVGIYQIADFAAHFAQLDQFIPK